MSVLSKSQLYEFRNSTRYFSKAVTESLNEFSSETKTGKTTIFLSHKHDERKELDSVISFLKKINVNVYVDWLDEGMPKTTSGKTATRIKIKIKEKIKTEFKKQVEEIKTIIKKDVLNQKTDSTKLPEEKSPDIILEWKDEG